MQTGINGKTRKKTTTSDVQSSTWTLLLNAGHLTLPYTVSILYLQTSPALQPITNAQAVVPLLRAVQDYSSWMTITSLNKLKFLLDELQVKIERKMEIGSNEICFFMSNSQNLGEIFRSVSHLFAL